MNYIAITIKATEEEQETLISFLSELEATGFEQKKEEMIAYFDKDRFDEVAVKEVVNQYTFQLETIEEQNWNSVWESNFDPVVVDDFCAIRAEFHQPIKEVQHEIVITPKMSFGTGHHATTFMMVQQMRNISFSQKKVFDFGTGTGILAILAEKLGASSVVATDIDEWSINNATENMERNQCKSITLYQSATVPTDELFDVILANINRNVILDHLQQLYDTLHPDGILLLSGLLSEDEEVINKACQEIGLKLDVKKQRQNWISLLYTKGKPLVC